MNIVINVSCMCTRSKDTLPQKQIVNVASQTRQQSVHTQDSLTGRNIRERLRRGHPHTVNNDYRIRPTKKATRNGCTTTAKTAGQTGGQGNKKCSNNASKDYRLARSRRQLETWQHRLQTNRERNQQMTLDMFHCSIAQMIMNHGFHGGSPVF